jgi:hypothetical protein
MKSSFFLYSRFDHRMLENMLSRPFRQNSTTLPTGQAGLLGMKQGIAI